ncbi:MAG: hypothetical protein II742_00335 [Clostridia bacterium]|jgi:hypothetical protein|nr:hypothetical protein [Clostridia bacterium]
MDSVEKKIERIVRAGGEGKVYFPSDFFDCGSEKAVSKALQRLVASEVLMRMERGLYCFPTIDRKWGMGVLPAGSDKVLDAYIRRDGFRIGPCPGEAQNALGLSDQVVMNPVYTTDGPSRKIYYRKNACPIVLYHVSPRVFNYRSHIIMLTVIALEDIGKDSLWEFELDTLRAIYSDIPYMEIREDLKNTPSWIRNLILDFYGKRKNS